MYRYKLEPYKGKKSRYECPQCKQARMYTRYIDTLTGEYLPFEYGRCNRTKNCEYNINPYTEGYAKNTEIGREKVSKPARLEKPPGFVNEKQSSLIPDEVFFERQQYYERNYFVKYLQRIFEAETVLKLIQTYFIGTSSYWPGATVFFQVDKQGKIRAGKIMLYNSLTGGRVKKPFNHINWEHKVLKLDDYILDQCFFGEHLLAHHLEKPVAIVESEKTAIIASVYFPQFVWLATGSLDNLTVERCMPLKGRRTYLFPDLGGTQNWSKVAEKLSEIGDFRIVDMLERIANEQEKHDGLDIADYLIQFQVELFQANEKAGGSYMYLQDDSVGEIALTEHGYPATWDRNY